ncbi:MAG: TolC family protein, partial [Deltaproteobacteria bacterium]|nr:TolC family protein [Deltaproteobacteria bacterium]
AMGRIADRKLQHLEAESRVEIAKARLNASMGSPGDKPLNPVTPFAIEEEIKGEIEDWINTALSKRLDLETLQHQEDMARKEIDKSRAGHLPDLRLLGNYEINSEDFSDIVSEPITGNTKSHGAGNTSPDTQSLSKSPKFVEAYTGGPNSGGSGRRRIADRKK